jgi:hypothetical protein
VALDGRHQAASACRGPSLASMRRVLDRTAVGTIPARAGTTVAAECHCRPFFTLAGAGLARCRYRCDASASGPVAPSSFENANENAPLGPLRTAPSVITH